MYIDTHCHLNFKAFEADWQRVADRAVKAGVTKMIVVGADLETSARAVKLAKKHKNLWAAVGVHPHHGLSEINWKKLEKLAKEEKVAAIGECGLDFHVYQKSKYEKKEISPEVKTAQKKLFGQQIQLAKKLKLAMIIHNRETGEETLDTIKHFCTSDGQYPKGVFHCISGSKKLLSKILEMGFYIGIDGNVTYSQEVKILAKLTPLERMLLETDAPWLSPAPKRDLRNEPISVKIVAQCLARLKKVSIAKIETETTKSAERLFKFQ
ncbi:MAG: TatD family hydrolase [Candidatus Beckwithbacteria bacterium]